MPDYRKKKVNRLKGAFKPKKEKHRAAHGNEDIKMTSAKKTVRKSPKTEKEPESALKVVKGKKLERKRKTRIFLSTASAVLIVLGVLHLILPVGIAENAGNLTALIGGGSYPIDLESNDTLSTVSRGMYYYVLTNTHINAYSGNGKQIYSYSHGYENPILKTSKTRALIFDQGGNEAVIYNLRTKKKTLKTDNDIITAGISDSGTYAVVTRSDKYASVVTVYDKHNKRLYEWSSSADTVNNVAVSPNGKKIAVSLFNASSGKFTSKISVLEYDSATPKYTETIDETLVFALDSFHNAGFSAVTGKGYSFYAWSDFKKTEYKSEYSPAFLRSGTGGTAVVFNRESDRTDNRIVLFSPKGKVKSEFDYKGTISDIEVSGGHIYCICDTSAYLLSDDGKVLRQTDCGFGVTHIAPVGTNMLAAITDNGIQKIKLEGKGE